MATGMHRLQISLPHWEFRFLKNLAERQKVSIAEVIRTLVEKEKQRASSLEYGKSAWSIAGIFQEPELDDPTRPVSANVDYYLNSFHNLHPETPRSHQASQEKRKKRRG